MKPTDRLVVYMRKKHGMRDAWVKMASIREFSVCEFLCDPCARRFGTCLKVGGVPLFVFPLFCFCFQFLHLCEERGRDCHPIDSRERDDLIDSIAGVVVPSRGSP